MNLFDLLSADHARILQLATSLKVAGNVEDADLVLEDLRHALQVHARAEDEVLYRALRADSRNDDLAAWADSEHQQIELLAADLNEMGFGESNWRYRIQDLVSMVVHHFQMEEERIFERLRGQLSEEEITHLGAQVAAALQHPARDFGFGQEIEASF